MLKALPGNPAQAAAGAGLAPVIDGILAREVGGGGEEAEALSGFVQPGSRRGGWALGSHGRHARPGQKEPELVPVMR